MKNKLHPGAIWKFRFKAYFIITFLLIIFFWLPGREFLYSLLIGKISSFTIPQYTFVFLFLILIISEIYSRLTYNCWFYELTNEGIKIERGIIWKKYTSIPYERIQNIDIHRGIIAQIFNFSTLIIQTAGISGSVGAEGYIPAVDVKEAEKIKEFIIKKITLRRTK